MALLHAMRALRERYGYELQTAHLNHGIRGPEAARDEAFVRELCAQLGVGISVERAEGLFAGMANLEERAREARHAFLNRVASRTHADHIALAHQADDQAETVLLRLLRGAGVAGLGAMDERGPGRVIRPMLRVRREDVLAYLRAAGANFVTDSTNESPAILRNRIRSRLAPALERDYAPGLRRRLFELAAEMRSVGDFMGGAARAELCAMTGSGGALSLGRFSTLHPALQAWVLRLFLQDRIGSLRRLGRAHIEAVRRLCLCGPPNGMAHLPGQFRAEREYGLLRVVDGPAPTPPRYAVVLAREGTTAVPEAGVAFDAEVVPSAGLRTPESGFEAFFDAGKAEPLVARSFKPGDRIAPAGLRGHRKVKDVFIDAKLPRRSRAVFPIVEAGGEVAWLPGLVRGHAALVTEATASVLRVRARPVS